LFRDFAGRPASSKTRQCYFRFLLSPVELIGKDKLEKIVFEKNTLNGDPFNQSARGTGEKEELEAGILFRSIGYRGVPIQGIPFDEKRGVFPNENGRITDNGTVVPQLYVAGWIKRGPTGIIGTNRADSVATVNSLLEDVDSLPAGQKPGAESLLPLLEERNIRFISYPDWKKIDGKEIDRGKPAGKPREKFTDINEMLAVLEQE